MHKSQAQNEHIITCDLHDEKIAEVIKQAVTKGQEVLITSFSTHYPDRYNPGFFGRFGAILGEWNFRKIEFC